ncbi:MAG TPA: hypothetical protein VF334_01125, partial [Polyangia bacterium]
MLARGGVIAALWLVAGCGPGKVTRDCMGAGDMGALVSNAALLRLEVYGAMAHCHGNDLAPGAGVAVASHTFAHGEPITLDVPAGAHALVLTTYADSSGAHILGHGCLEVSVVAGSQSCFDLPVAADGNPGDGGSARPDGGGSDGGSAACGNQNQPCCAGATP